MKQTKNDVRLLLSKHKHPLEEKEFNRLWKLVKAREISIGEHDGLLVITMRIVILRLSYSYSKLPLMLIEKRRHQQRRIHECVQNDGISRKIYTNETPGRAANRCLWRKLGISKEAIILRKIPFQNNNGLQRRQKFGYILTKIERHYFEGKFPPSRFNPQGFTRTRISENGVKKKSEFWWIPIQE